MILNLTPRKRFLFIIFIIYITDITVLIEIPILKEIFSLIFLTFLPGLLIIQIIKINRVHILSKFLLIVGLSLSFLMFFGVLFNNLSIAIGYTMPLAQIPILIVFNIVFILLATIGYKINDEAVFSVPEIALLKSEKIFLIPLLFFPLLSVIGIQIMNKTGNNVILMLFFLLIPIYIFFVCFFNRKVPCRFLPIIIFIISLSLVILLPFRSNHILGYDIHTEYYLFQIVSEQSHWSIVQHSTLDSCLSITLLPSIYQSMLKVDSEILFRFFYTLLFSIVPLIIYVISKKYIKEIYAFLASFFFMSQEFFILIEMNPRTSLAILFFALAMMVLFTTELNSFKKRILFIIFMASCIVSHYTTTYLFLLILVISCIILAILSTKYKIKKELNLLFPILLFSLMFFWYSQITEASFEAGVNFLKDSLVSLRDIFIVESRGETFGELFGTNIVQENNAYIIKFIFTWITFVLIGIGILASIKKLTLFQSLDSVDKKPEFLVNKFDFEYIIIGGSCVGLLLITVILPYIIGTYDLHRIYSFVTVILAVFFIIGGIFLLKIYITIKNHLVKNEKNVKNINCKYPLQIIAFVILLIVLIPTFLSNTGFVYALYNDSRPILLSSAGDGYNTVYSHDHEILGVRWIKIYKEENALIYTDKWQNYFLSQGKISQNSLRYFFTQNHKIEGYIFLRYYNINQGKYLSDDYKTYNISKYYTSFFEKNLIYNNCGSEVWR